MMASQPKSSLGILYIVATPIGNLRDITHRALDVLASVDHIAAEDTRQTRKLLTHWQINTPLFALHEHNEREVTQRLLQQLKQGERVALVSDAGTPLISDPGFYLVQHARAQDIHVVPIPGPCAAITALSAAGLASQHFLFIGFLAPKKNARQAQLNALALLPYTLIFYEAPHRIQAMLSDVCHVLGTERLAVVAREMTKQYETIHQAPLGELITWLETQPHKGEYVVLVEGAQQTQTADEQEGRRILAILQDALPLKQAAQLAAQITGLKKNQLYQWGLEKTAIK